jgi:hemerythrin-like domain-containing protein
MPNATPHNALQHSLQIIQDEHAALAAMLRSLRMMVDRGPDHEQGRFFDVLRAMLFYIDEFPERLHHPKESALLFPKVAQAAPETREAIARLERDHSRSEAGVRELQHMLLGWELVGDSRRAVFEQALARYIDAYLAHMQLEETAILPAAQRTLRDDDWKELDAAFGTNCDLLTGKYPRDPTYDRLFTKIVMIAPAPIGLGH